MALQWMIMAYVVAAEAAVALVVTLPSPNALRKHLVSAVSLVLQPALFVVPFAAFHLLDIYWKNEHRLMCTSEGCTAAETHRYHKQVCLSTEFVSIRRLSKFWRMWKRDTRPSNLDLNYLGSSNSER